MATKDQKDKAWENARKVGGKNPNIYRKDPYGNLMYRNSYGKSSKMGWELDHIRPKSKGGSDATRNTQALNTSENRIKGNDQRKKSRHSKSNK